MRTAFWLVALSGLGVASATLAEDAVPVQRIPVGQEQFAAFATWYAYDADLPLRAEVLSTQTHDGRELPYLTDKVHFRSIHDQVVVGYFARPKSADSLRAPVVILLHGNNRYRGSQDTWTRTWLDLLTRAGYCALAIDQYGYGERFVPGKAPDFFGEMGPHEVRDVLRQQVVDARRAIDYVRSRPEADTTRIVLMGESMGGLVTCLAAGIESRLAGVVMVVTGAWGGATDDPFWGPLHPLNFAPRISAPSLMVYSKHDGVELGQELYDHLPEPRAIIWHDINDHVILVEDQKPGILAWLAEHVR